MRRYVGCACVTSASGSSESLACNDETCGPAVRGRRRRSGRLSDYDVETWLEDLSTIADCDVSRSLFDKNDEVCIFLPVSVVLKQEVKVI